MLKHILLIGNDSVLQDVLSLYFMDQGVDVEMQNDADALPNDIAKPLDLILINHSSVFDGLKICQRLQMRLANSHIPVMIMSVFNDIKYPALLAGAVAFVDMPFDLFNLRVSMEYWVKNAAKS